MNRFPLLLVFSYTEIGIVKKAYNDCYVTVMLITTEKRYASGAQKLLIKQSSHFKSYS